MVGKMEMIVEFVVVVDVVEMIGIGILRRDYMNMMMLHMLRPLANCIFL